MFTLNNKVATANLRANKMAPLLVPDIVKSFNLIDLRSCSGYCDNRERFFKQYENVLALREQRKVLALARTEFEAIKKLV